MVSRKSIYQFATLFGLFGLVLAVLAHTIHFYFADITMPGYSVFMAPGMLLLSFFTEELSYKVKMILLLSGQFIGYAVISAFIAVIRRKLFSE
ncbi:hypothetical protein [Thalassotalea sediminis]|uniref:hypothetical protein n=1 Tax=Thalassotalea sediminis TaxID=1759089 RepID=UPI002573322B|nr:hypothetical protein [Thalassotalea sediminis]